MSTPTQRQVRPGEATLHSPSEPVSRPWALVAGREVRVKLTDKNFLLSTGFTLLVLVAVFAVQAFFIEQASSPEYRVAVVEQSSADAEEVVEQTEQALATGLPGATLQTVPVADEAAGEAAIEAGEADVVLLQQDGVWTVGADGSPEAGLVTAIEEGVRASVLAANAASAGTTADDLLSGTEVATVDYSGEDAEGSAVVFVAGLVFGMLFYIASLLFGLSIAQSVVEEKQSRIVEILTAAIPVQQLLTGKVLGNTLLAFGQMALIVGVSLIGLSFTDYDAFLPMLTEPLLWYLPFFVCGFIALACVWAAAGALAARSEDLQTTTLPLTLVLVAIFLVATNLDGTWHVVGSYVPVMSTIVMPVRLLEGDAAWWEPGLSLLVTLAFCWLTIRFGARLYRRALLQTQGRLTFRQALRLRD